MPKKKSALRVAASAVLLTSVATVALATPPESIHVPPGDLVTALKSISMQSGVELIFQPEQLKGLRTRGVSGSLPLEEAVRKLLEGTPLELRMDEATGAMMIGSAAPPSKQNISARAPLRIAQATPMASDVRAGTHELEEIVVTSKIIFTQNDAFGATKMGLAIVDTPQTVTVITSDMMEALEIRNLDDINRVLPGSSRTYDFMGNENFYFRGFQNGQDNSLRVDGFRMPSETKLNPLLFDRIEIIQGATATMYGQNNPAGTINVVSKMPRKKFGMSMRGDVGSNEYYNASADITGPIGDSDWAYLVVAGRQDYGTQYDHSRDEKLAGAAAIQYQDDVKRFLVRLSHQERDASAMRASYFQFDRPVPAGMSVANALAADLLEIVPLQDVPRSRYIGMPWSAQDERITALQVQFDYNLENDWVVRSHFQKADVSMDVDELGHWGVISSTGASERERLSRNVYNDSSYGMELNLFGPFQAFGRQHTAFVGVDYALVKQGDSGAGNELNFGVYGSNYNNTRFNIYSPDYGVYSPADLDTFPGAASVGRTRSSAELVYSGLTAQIVLNPIERLSVLLGGRYSYDTSASRNVSGTNVSPEQIKTQYLAAARTYDQYRNTVGQVGLTYEIVPKVNLYASYGETFTPTSARQWVDGLPNGRAIGTQDGKNTEVGVKAEIATWSARLTAFDAQRTNITEADLAHPGFSLPIGNQTGRGIETAVQGQVLPRFNVFAGITYLDAEYKEGQLAGMRPPNAPEWSLSFFSTYEFVRLPGFGVGMGLTHKRDLHAPDSRYRDSDGSIYSVDLGDITEVDARVFYGWRNWNFHLSGTNLTDERYVTASNTNLIVNTHVNPGREVRAGVKYSFE